MFKKRHAHNVKLCFNVLSRFPAIYYEPAQSTIRNKVIYLFLRNSGYKIKLKITVTVIPEKSIVF